MTKGQFFLYVFLAATVLFAVFVWPTRYRHLNSQVDADGVLRSVRVDRLSERVEIESATGEWVELAAPPPKFDHRDTPSGHAVGKTEQAAKDIRKMNEVSKKATDHPSPLE